MATENRAGKPWRCASTGAASARSAAVEARFQTPSIIHTASEHARNATAPPSPGAQPFREETTSAEMSPWGEPGPSQRICGPGFAGIPGPRSPERISTRYPRRPRRGEREAMLTRVTRNKRFSSSSLGTLRRPTGPAVGGFPDYVRPGWPKDGPKIVLIGGRCRVYCVMDNALCKGSGPEVCRCERKGRSRPGVQGLADRIEAS